MAFIVNHVQILLSWIRGTGMKVNCDIRLSLKECKLCKANSQMRPRQQIHNLCNYLKMKKVIRTVQTQVYVVLVRDAKTHQFHISQRKIWYAHQATISNSKLLVREERQTNLRQLSQYLTRHQLRSYKSLKMFNLSLIYSQMHPEVLTVSTELVKVMDRFLYAKVSIVQSANQILAHWRLMPKIAKFQKSQASKPVK